MREKKELRRVGNPPLVFGEFIQARPQGCFVFYRRSCPSQHDHRTCPIHKADTEAYKTAHRSKKGTSANVREAKLEVSKDELSKLMMVGTELPKEIQESNRAWGPKLDKNNDKDEDKKGKSRWRKKGGAVNEVAAEEDTPTTDAPTIVHAQQWSMPTTPNILNSLTRTVPGPNSPAVLAVHLSIELNSALHICVFPDLGTCPHGVRVHIPAHPVARVPEEMMQPLRVTTRLQRAIYPRSLNFYHLMVMNPLQVAQILRKEIS